MNKATHPLHKPKARKNIPALPKLAAWDIETEGLGGSFIIAALACSDGQRMLFDNLDAVLEWIINHPEYRYLAHNASGYEFAYLYPLLYDWFNTHAGYELHPSIQGDTRLIQFRVIKREQIIGKRGKPTAATKTTTIDLRDTLCLFNASLDDVAKAFCPEMPKLKENIDFEKVVFDPSNESHMAYLWRDCDILLAAYPRFYNQLRDAFGVEPGITAGATAMRAFQATIPDGHVYWRINPEVEDFVRKAYYGGLVIPGKRIGRCGPTGSVDINAAYAFQMVSHEYPIGSATATWKYVPGYQGFYHVIAAVPFELYETLGFNPIPYRGKEGLSWPSGTFETYITSYEVEYAREKGCTIDIICGYYFTRTENVFEPFVTKCQELELANGGVYKPTIKLLRNSLYGKFATQKSHVALLFTKDDTKENVKQLIPYTNEENGDIIEGMYLYKEESDANYMLPHWAALITAHQRLYLMKFIEEAYKRGANTCYCDTDSIKCSLGVLLDMVSDGFIPIGKYYGQFKVEEICKDFIVLGPKCFLGELEKQEVVDEIIRHKPGTETAVGDGKRKVVSKAKGIPQRKLKDEDVATIIYEQAIEALKRKNPTKMYIDKEGMKRRTGREIDFDTVKSTMSIIKEKSSVRPERKQRTITDIRNSAAWDYQNGKILPRRLINATTFVRTGGDVSYTSA